MTKAKNESEEVLELSKEKFNDIAETVSELHDSMRNKTQQVAEDSVEFVKKYPLHTAVGAGVLGFLAGYATKKMTEHSSRK